MVLKHILHSSKSLIIACVIIVGLSIFLRFAKLDKVFSEYDDIGVVALYKLPQKKKSVTFLSNEFIDLRGTVQVQKIAGHLLDSPLFAPYMGYTWTYPPGQYLLYPLLLSEQDSPQKKIWWGRAVSAFFSTLSVILLIYFLSLLNKGKLNWAILLAVMPLAFSFNNIIYAHHMSPYSLAVTILLSSLILFHFTLSKKLSYVQFSLAMGVLVYFSYFLLFCTKSAINVDHVFNT